MSATSPEICLYPRWPCQTSILKDSPLRSTESHFLPPSFPLPPSFLSLLPPLSISKWPAFDASSFSVCPTKPDELLCLILFCVMMEVFFGLMTRAPGFGPVREGLVAGQRQEIEVWHAVAKAFARPKRDENVLASRYGLRLFDCALSHSCG